MSKHTSEIGCDGESQLHSSAARSGQFSSYDNPPSLWPDFLTGQPERPVRVAVVEDDPGLRRVISQELMADPRTILVAEAGSGREAKRLIRSHEVDVMLIELHLRDGLGHELITHARNLLSSIHVVALSASEDDDGAMRAFELGAVGFIAKTSWFGSFVQAVLQVANGGAFLTPGLARRLLLELDRTRGADGQAVRTPGRLSDREREILRLVANGLTSKDIGTRLAISTLTVNSHVRNVSQKLHVKTRAQAVSSATTLGIL